MTKYIRQKHKLHVPVAPVSDIVYQNQVKTEVSIAQKNIEKLIFIESDDDEPLKPPISKVQHPASSRQKHRNNDLSLNRRRQVGNPFKPASSMLRPSLMRTSSDNEDQYESIPNCESAIVSGRNVKLTLHEKRRSVPVANNNFFDDFISSRDYGRGEQIAYRLPLQNGAELVEKPKYKKIPSKSKLKKDRSTVERKEGKEEGNKEEQKMEIPKMQITALYFQMSDEEGEKVKDPSSKATSFNLADILNKKDQMDLSDHQREQQQAIQANYPQPAAQIKVDITDTAQNKQLNERSQYLQEFIKSSPTCEQILHKMLIPINLATRQIFEVHIYSTFSEKQYFFWLNMGPEMRLLLKAKKSVRLNRSEFQILAYNSLTEQYIQACRIESNMDRSKFNILKVDRSTNNKRIMGTVVNSVSLHNSKLLVMYYPKIDANNLPAIFNLNEASTDLQEIYRQNQIKMVDFVMTTKLDMTKKLKMMSHHQLRASQKSMEFKDNEGDIKMIIGKRGSKRYKIIAGAGLTPIQIFSMVIVQVQT